MIKKCQNCGADFEPTKPAQRNCTPACARNRRRFSQINRLRFKTRRAYNHKVCEVCAYAYDVLDVLMIDGKHALCPNHRARALQGYDVFKPNSDEPASSHT